MVYKLNLDRLLKEKMKLQNYSLGLEKKNPEGEMKANKNMF